MKKSVEVKNINKATDVPYWQPGLLMFTRLSGWIIGPILIGIIVGRWLDERYNTEPWLFLTSIGIAFTISTVGLVKDAFAEMAKLEKNDKEKMTDSK